MFVRPAPFNYRTASWELITADTAWNRNGGDYTRAGYPAQNLADARKMAHIARDNVRHKKPSSGRVVIGSDRPRPLKALLPG
jgi:homoserine acetyltransferase